MTATGVHAPARPWWTCRGDGQPWPCPAARARLRVEYAGNRRGLAILMGCCLAEAAGELPGAAPGELFARFLSWTRSDGEGGAGHEVADDPLRHQRAGLPAGGDRPGRR